MDREKLVWRVIGAVFFIALLIWAIVSVANREEEEPEPFRSLYFTVETMEENCQEVLDDWDDDRERGISEEVRTQFLVAFTGLSAQQVDLFLRECRRFLDN